MHPKIDDVVWEGQTQNPEVFFNYFSSPIIETVYRFILNKKIRQWSEKRDISSRILIKLDNIFSYQALARLMEQMVTDVLENEFKKSLTKIHGCLSSVRFRFMQS